ncbi:hypothetical protein HDR70_00365 [bacterium]|nr:hypothetical protein [bacterium]
MSVKSLKEQWEKKDEGLSFVEYYNKYENREWHRSNPKRNYQRNRDIVESASKTKRNDRDVSYRLASIEGGRFVLNGQYLDYSFEDEDYNSSTSIELIRPLSYVVMDVDDDVMLYAEIPIIATDVRFTIEDGKLYAETD